MKLFLPKRSKLLLTIIFLLSTLIYIIIITLTTSSYSSTSTIPNTLLISTPPSLSTSLHHIAFSIASNHNSWLARQEYVKLWWNSTITRGCVFLDQNNNSSSTHNNTSLPPVCIYSDTSRFRYTFQHGHRSAIQIAHIISDIINLNLPDIHWYVFGDDDTIFFPENLATTLSKYNHNLRYYIGYNSETHGQNQLLSFNMAFGGAGFAISATLAQLLSKVLDSCLERYPHLYGSDSRVYSCLTEVGFELTREQGFHQMDIRGDAHGLLMSHPLTPVVSLHHLEQVIPIFPKRTRIEAVRHLFKAVEVDSLRVLQTSVCYDRWFEWTILISWGYAVEIHHRHVLLPEILPVEETFNTWKRNQMGYMFDTRPRKVHDDQCGGGLKTVFYFDEVLRGRDGMIKTKYKKMVEDYVKCRGFDKVKSTAANKFEEVVVLSRKYVVGMDQLLTPRRQCCDVLPPSKEDRMEIRIRECKEDELIYMHP